MEISRTARAQDDIRSEEEASHNEDLPNRPADEASLGDERSSPASQEQPDRHRSQVLSRREVLQLAGATALNASPLLQVAYASFQDSVDSPVLRSVRVVRPWDLLVLDVSWRNLALVPAGFRRPPRLKRIDRTQPAYLIIGFPPQHLGERAFRGQPSALKQQERQLARPSRIVFEMPPDQQEIEYSLYRLLEAGVLWPMALSERPGTEPLPEETALEIPYGLVLSPVREEGERQAWLHSLGCAAARECDPATGARRVELWHTRLTSTAGVMRLRALYARPEDLSDKPGELSSLPSREDRTRLVEQMSKPGADLVEARRVMLSSLGAWLDARYHDPLQRVSGWRQQTMMGRDQFVQVVKEGYLLPFGHRASHITTRERRFPGSDTAPPVSYLHEEVRILVREPVKNYVDPDRRNPFRSVHILTEITPPEVIAVDPIEVRSSPGPFQFRIAATDHEGQVSEFPSQLTFMPLPAPGGGTPKASGQLKSVRVNLQGQKLSVAPGTPERSTALETYQINLSAVVPSESDPSKAFPVLEEAQVIVPAVKQILGDQKGGPQPVKFADAYLDPSQRNSAEVFLSLVKPVELPSSNTSGMGELKLFLTGLSRSSGVVCGPDTEALKDATGKLLDPDVRKAAQKAKLDEFAKGQFKPEDFFAEAKLMGAIELKAILQGLTSFSTADSGKDVPKLAVELELPKDPLEFVPEAIKATFDFQTTKLQPMLVFAPRRGAELLIHSVLRKELKRGRGTTLVSNGHLKNFDIRLFGNDPFIIIQFDSLAFSSRSGEKAQLKPEIGDVRFGGPLKFLEEMRTALAKAKDGFSLAYVDNGIRAGYTQRLPDLTLGALRCSNISVAAGLHLPLTGARPLSFSFGFGQRFNPFQVAVAQYTGGGYFEIELTPTDLVRLEAAIEFGNSASLDLGVAKGKAEVMIGIRYVMKTLDASYGGKSEQKRSVTLEGYVRASGALDVLGIVTMSVLLYAALIYDVDRNEVWGRATVTAEVRTLVFSDSVTFTYEQRFAGSGGGSGSAGGPAFAPPEEDTGPATFARLVSRIDWQNYWAAFA